MTTVNYTPAQMPTLLEVVNRVLNECGIQSQPNLTSSQFLGTVTAMNAVNDAVNDIKMRNRWEWIKTTAVLTLVPGISSYTMPSDFVSMAHPMMMWDGTNLNQTLQELTPDEFWQMYPPTNISTPGTPSVYMVDSNVTTLWPSPSASFIATYPQLRYIYFKAAARPLTVADQALTLDIPAEFLEAVVAFGKWKMKLFLEYPDWQAEQARYEQAIRVQINRTNAGRRAPRMRLTYPSNTVW